MHKLDKEMINDTKFPGISAIERDFLSWDWIFGMNPPFTLIFKCGKDKSSELMRICVKKGYISNVECVNDDLDRFMARFLGQRFDLEKVDEIYNFVKNFSQKDVISCLVK